MDERDYLFHEGDLSATLDAHGRQVGGKVDSINPDRALTAPLDDLVKEIMRDMSIEPLTILEDRMTRDQQETQIDVTGWPDRFTWGDGPCLVPGIRVVVSLPFTGDVGLWRLRPNTFSSVLPHGTVRGSVLDMTFELPMDSALEKLKQALDENVKTIRDYVGWQRGTVTEFNSALPGRIRSAIEARRKRLAQHDKLGEILNIPLATPGTVSGITSPASLSARNPTPASPRSRSTASTGVQTSWDVFISHASEDKDAFVRDLAAGLAAKGLKVWYDEFTLTLGDSLRRSIDHGLANSRFGIVVLSHNFFAKEWPQKELDGLVAREASTGKLILPIWHDLTKDDIARYSPVLADRLAVSSAKGIAHVVNEILVAIRRKAP